MSGDSTHAGILAPLSSTDGEADAALDLIVQAWVASVTGLAGDMVRPRWQPTPPPQPPQEADWVAVGCTSYEPDAYSATVQRDSDTAQLHRHATAEFMMSFYGPNASALALRLRDGALIGQNRDPLAAHGLAIQHISAPNRAPILSNEVWRGRTDIAIHFRRETVTLYPIKTLLSAPTHFTNDPS